MVSTILKLFAQLGRNARRVIVLSVFSLTFFVAPTALFAANITITPSSVTTKVGKTFTVDILVSNNTDNINAVSAALSFPSDVLSVTALSKAGSFINLWAEEPSYSNANGTVSLEGVALNPGFSGASGKVISVTFKAKQAGNINVSIKSGSVLANDGNATNVTGTLGSLFVIVNEATDTADTKPEEVKPTNDTLIPAVTSPTHTNSDTWYKSREATFEWIVPPQVTAVRTLYNEKESTTPNKVYDPPVPNRSFTTDGDGVMYMHVQFKNGSTWGPVAHFKFQIDTQAPETLSASFPDGAVTTNTTPAIQVLTEDSLSGVDFITMSIDQGEAIKFPVDATHLYRLPRQISGKHTVVISSVDKAGNVSTVSLDFTIQALTVPTITEYTKKVTFENPLKVAGATYPSSTVEVALLDSDGNIETETTTSDETGAFRLSWSKNLSRGVYEMKARVIDSKGSASDYTNNKAIIVDYIPLVKLGIFVMNWLSVILILVIASFCIVGTFWYSLVQFQRFRRKVRRTISEVENTLRTNVVALRRDTEEFHTILVKAEKKRELTKEEQAILKKFKKRLEITEKEIDKKLEQIG
jgi:hypothetical protein